MHTERTIIHSLVKLLSLYWVAKAAKKKVHTHTHTHTKVIDVKFVQRARGNQYWMTGFQIIVPSLFCNCSTHSKEEKAKKKNNMLDNVARAIIIT